MGGGYVSLSKQLVNTFQNLNRGNSFNALKRKKKNEDSSCDSERICNSDQYSCVNWQPESETLFLKKKKKETMKSWYKQGPLCYKSSNFLALLSDAYYTQRTEVNKKQLIEYLISLWPLLRASDYI